MKSIQIGDSMDGKTKKPAYLTRIRTTTACLVLMIFISAGNSPAAPCRYLVPGDLDNDCKVGLSDLSIMASNWLTDCNQLPLDPACVDNLLMVQRYQFHTIEIAIEMFGATFGFYPPSSDNENVSFPEVPGKDPNTYLGANKLAEAVLGMDLWGFHPHSDFRSDGQSARNDGTGGYEVYEVYEVYHANADDPGNAVGQFAETAAENVAARRGPFIELEDARVFRLADIYEDVNSFNGSTLVLCDVFEKVRSSGKKTGMPILYFRANTIHTEQDSSDGIEDDIYYYPDNQALLELGSAENQLIKHPVSDGIDDWLDFEGMILNPNFPEFKRPFRASSFILISAGADGLYGTSDDVFNFWSGIF